MALLTFCASSCAGMTLLLTSFAVTIWAIAEELCKDLIYDRILNLNMRVLN